MNLLKCSSLEGQGKKRKENEEYRFPRTTSAWVTKENHLECVGPSYLCAEFEDGYCGRLGEVTIRKFIGRILVVQRLKEDLEKQARKRQSPETFQKGR